MADPGGASAEPARIDQLDDLCLSHVAACTETLKDLLSLGSTCRRLRAVVAGADTAWQRRILADFGLPVRGYKSGGVLKRQYDLLRHASRGEAPPPPALAPAPASGPGSGSGPSTAAASGTASAAAGSSSSSAAGGGGGASGGSGLTPPTTPSGAGRHGAGGQAGGVRPFLPFAGVATDGGCDTPWADFWAGHLFNPSSRTFYSSESQTTNVHCVAVLQPDGSSPCDPHRAFLLDRLQLPAAYLSRDVMRSIMTDQAWEGGASPHHLPPDPLPRLPERAVGEARRVLGHCTTEVLEDLYVHVYNQMTQGRAWGMLLIRGLGGAGPDADEALQEIHHKAWQIWHNQRSVPYDIRQANRAEQPRLLYGEPPLRALLPSGPGGPCSGPGPGPGSGPRLGTPSTSTVCAPTPAPHSRTVGLFDSVLLSRHLNVTCPLRCGVLFAAVTGNEPGGGGAGGGGAGGGGGAAGVGAAGAAGGAAGGGGGAAGAALSAATLAAGLTNGLASLPVVQVFNNAADIFALLPAIQAGILPPIAGYFTNGWLEWVEFERPAAPLGEPPQRRRHAFAAATPAPPAAATAAAAAAAAAPARPAVVPEAAAAAADGGGGGSAAAAGTGGGGGGSDGAAAGADPADPRVVPCLDLDLGAGSGLAACVLPVLWFRFFTRRERYAMRRRGAAAQQAPGAAEAPAEAPAQEAAPPAPAMDLPPAVAGLVAGLAGAQALLAEIQQGLQPPGANAAAPQDMAHLPDLAQLQGWAQLEDHMEQLAEVLQAAMAQAQAVQANHPLAEGAADGGGAAADPAAAAAAAPAGNAPGGEATAAPLPGPAVAPPPAPTVDVAAAPAAAAAPPPPAAQDQPPPAAAQPPPAPVLGGPMGPAVAAGLLELMALPQDEHAPALGVDALGMLIDQQIMLELEQQHLMPLPEDEDPDPVDAVVQDAIQDPAADAAAAAAADAAAPAEAADAQGPVHGLAAAMAAAMQAAAMGLPPPQVALAGGQLQVVVEGQQVYPLLPAAATEAAAAAAAAVAAGGQSVAAVAGPSTSQTAPPSQAGASPGVGAGPSGSGSSLAAAPPLLAVGHSPRRRPPPLAAGDDSDDEHYSECEFEQPTPDAAAVGYATAGAAASGSLDGAGGSRRATADGGEDAPAIAAAAGGGGPIAAAAAAAAAAAPDVGAAAAAAAADGDEDLPALESDPSSDEEDDADVWMANGQMNESDEEEDDEFDGAMGPWPPAPLGPPAAAAGAAATLDLATAAAAACNAALSVAAAAGGPPLPTAQAVITAAMPIFPISPNLTALAPGIGHLYGWAAPPGVDHMVQLRLKQPWCANLLLAKLVSCEDLRPAFNRSRGGCNIDAGIVTVQGPEASGGEGGGPLVPLIDGVVLL
ncbi:hypothetical protein HYH03_003971 [Edaphochlamys debaryana]|uniref:Uncharacterized protein n=1 Tax=Edaphochlamys debaryana TaxID=47281 RepID=A0A836C2Y0_9CHLO|nr:hypothetical protein HYH03_003971 [Edaphochlamys debaryana]|eukprot:KAG2498220.1 hypothetical protein HYH03_003971 [Edaphochlamys debaryana]